MVPRAPLAMALLLAPLNAGAVEGPFNAALPNPTDEVVVSAPRDPSVRNQMHAINAWQSGVIEKALPSVATIIVEVYKTKSGGLLLDLLGRQITVPVGTALGTGWVVRKDGLLVTNNHVVDSVPIKGTVYVQFSDHLNHPATVVAKNPIKDLALLKLVETDLARPALPLGDSRDIKRGERVIAIGSPMSQRETATSGIISGVRIEQGFYPSRILQTDAAVNHGNSGGPLLNIDGEVIGVNFSIISPTAQSGSIGLNFAIPVENVKSALRQYDRDGRLSNVHLGVQFSATDTTPLGETVERLMGKKSTPKADVAVKGVTIVAVEPKSSAEAAGLKPGDQIVALDEIPITGSAEDTGNAFLAAIAEKSPKDTVQLTIFRRKVVAPDPSHPWVSVGIQALSVTVTLEEAPTHAH